MATVILQAAGQYIGQNVFNSQFAAAVLSAAGAYAGNRIDQAVFGKRFTQEGPRLSEAKITSSTEGKPIPRLWGRQRMAGELIWSTRFLETVTTTKSGGKGGSSAPKTETTTYAYSVSFAIAFCEGPASAIGRIWADGMLLEQGKYTIRFYPGDEAQTADPLIASKESVAPAFRGTCYLVFENMALADFGNRMPQITAEVFKPLASGDAEVLENRVSAVTLIPASGEFAYGTETYVKTYRGSTDAENAHNGFGTANLIKALDSLESGLPNANAVALVCSWFGDDLRVGSCTLRPKVETNQPKQVRPRDWRVSGLTRSSAQVVSTHNGANAYGGTPSDDTIVDAIQELQARGMDVVFYPFILMDIAAGNTLANPYSANAATAGQPIYPWRGRITCSPAAGFTGTVDKTATAATQVDAFFGTCTPAHFSWNAGARSVDYSGPSEWSFRRLILHYATLCAAAGGVDAFIIGSEMVGMTAIRSGASTYPAVAKLQALLADVRTILGAGTKLGYAADWSEYHSHRPGDGSGDVFFNLDPLWADANLDFVGIDNYMPLADWRDGSSHLDAALGGPYDRAYLRSNIEGGEYHAWFYADQTARDAQVRTTITDGAGKPWVFRNKDIRNWWTNAHYNRPGGVEAGSPTSWTAQGKPVWFTELGCPAIDKGANQPNVFVDPKSSETAFPHYSNGARDDLAQRRFLEALLGYWSDTANNPASGVYSGRMIDASRMFVWTWDARPFPEFPQRADVWGDTENWRLGHWLTGRVGVAPLAELIRQLCALVGFTDADLDLTDILASEALVIGFNTTDRSSPRELIATLSDVYLFDGFESGGKLKFVRRGAAPSLTIDAGDIVVGDDGAPMIEVTRAQEIDLPRAVTLQFVDEDKGYEIGAVTAGRVARNADGKTAIEAPLVLTPTAARALAEARLYESWAGRESADITIAPRFLRIDPGDVLTLPKAGRTFEMRVLNSETGAAKKLGLVQTDARIYTAPELAGRPPRGDQITLYGPPEIRFMDLPLLADTDSPHQPYIAAYASPWPGREHVYRNVGGSYTLITEVIAASIVGETLWDLYSGPTGRWDDGNYIQILSYGGELASVTEDALFSGANTIAIENASGEWEILQFQNATLVAPGQYQISRLLRGQLGTEGAMRSPVAAGAKWALLDRARLAQLAITQADRNNALDLKYGPGTAAYDATSYTQLSKTFQAIGLRPFSPAQVRGNWLSNGDAKFTWVRRTRIGGDDWEQIEVPLVAPDLQQYDVEILSDDEATVIRTISGLGVEEHTYTLAQQTADFGAQKWNFKARIYQISSVVGRGYPWKGLVYPTIFGP
jgi:hypothetical protein